MSAAITSPHHRFPIRKDDIDAAERSALRRYKTWRRFHNGVRKLGGPLLKTIARYPNAVMVAGCQRSGTTMLTRIIAGATGFRGLALTDDDELDAALALGGQINLPTDFRYCFQTTYLNEQYTNYATLGPGHKLIWVVRNPNSVIYSMVYNWRRFALNELYEACGVQLTDSERLRRSHLPWPLGPSNLEKACLSYSGKNQQIHEIHGWLGAKRMLIIDYDQLAASPAHWLPGIFRFIGEPYDPAYAENVRQDSIRKAKRLSDAAKALIERHTQATYRQCLALTQTSESVLNR
jgi:hypothetical protein